jgi:hypothetical protein
MDLYNSDLEVLLLLNMSVTFYTDSYREQLLSYHYHYYNNLVDIGRCF